MLGPSAWAQTAGGSCVGTNKGNIWGNGGGLLLNCNGATWDTMINAAANTASGSTGYVQFNDAGTFGGDSNLFWDNTNKRLGIGTSAPQAGKSLTVNGAGWMSSLVVNGGGIDMANGTMSRIGTISGTLASGIVIDANNASAPIIFQTGGTTERARFDSSGNLGLGTSAPSQALEVYGSTPTLQITATANSRNIQISPSSGSIESSNSYLSLNRSSSQGVTLVQGGGYVGIGTASPSAVLHVYSSGGNTEAIRTQGYVSFYDSTNATRNGYIQATAQGLKIAGNTNASSNLQFFTNNVLTMYMDANNKVGIGSTTPVASLDLSQKTDAVALPSGTTAQQPASPVAGMIRYNSTLGKPEYYSGSAWLPFKASGAPAGAGYFVLTTAKYSGDLGSAANAGGNTGIAAGNAICLNELTTNTGWWGYASANAAGLLNASHVFAFLCDGTTCNNLTASTNYYFANTNDSTAGGAYFTTDASGLGPNDSNAWVLGSYFAGAGTFGNSNPWTGRAGASNTVWPNSSSTSNCSGWTSSSSGVSGTISQPGFSDLHRWTAATVACSTTERLYCYVNP